MEEKYNEREALREKLIGVTRTMRRDVHLDNDNDFYLISFGHVSQKSFQRMREAFPEAAVVERASIGRQDASMGNYAKDGYTKLTPRVIASLEVHLLPDNTVIHVQTYGEVCSSDGLVLDKVMEEAG